MYCSPKLRSLRRLLALLVAGGLLFTTSACDTGPDDDPALGEPHPLSSLNEKCDSLTAGDVLARVRPEYNTTLSVHSEDDTTSVPTPLTIRARYEGGPLTCSPPGEVEVPPGSLIPEGLHRREQIGIVVEMTFLTDDGTFQEQFETTLLGSSRGVFFYKDLKVQTLDGMYQPRLSPDLEDLKVSINGSLDDDTGGRISEQGRRPEESLIVGISSVADWGDWGRP